MKPFIRKKTGLQNGIHTEEHSDSKTIVRAPNSHKVHVNIHKLPTNQKNILGISKKKIQPISVKFFSNTYTVSRCYWVVYSRLCTQGIVEVLSEFYLNSES